MFWASLLQKCIGDINNFHVNRAFLDLLPLVQMSFMNGPIDKIVWQRRVGKAKAFNSHPEKNYGKSKTETKKLNNLKFQGSIMSHPLDQQELSSLH